MRRCLFGTPDLSHAADANPLHQPVRADAGERDLAWGRSQGIVVSGLGHGEFAV